WRRIHRRGQEGYEGLRVEWRGTRGKTCFLKIIDYREWYIIEGKFRASKTTELWKNLYEEAIGNGFKGLRVTGEMTCFFKHGMVRELVEYEDALHSVLELPIAAICAHNTDVISKEEGGELFLDLIKAHSTVIILGPELGLVKSY
ncbi:MAG: MEDS domain-containing protein, partial [Candidatus Bathyarchaeia archaeon]